MGTNYYVRGESHDAPEAHIGKRYGAGAYCFKCNVSLVVNGEVLQQCPGGCGATRWEAGYATGFIWAMDPEKLDSIKPRKACPTCGASLNDRGIGGDIDLFPIEDEYGETMGLEAFRELVANCQIQDRSAIGTRFS